MTTTALNNSTPAGRLEELVDRLLAPLFRDKPEPVQNLDRTVHEARRRRQSGDLDGALAVFAGADLTNATDGQARWLYAEWLDHRPPPVCWQRGNDLQPGHWQGGGAGCPRRWQPGSGGGAGDALAGGQDGIPAQPAGAAAPGERGCVMVVANGTVDLLELKARHPLGDTVEAAGVALRGKGRVRQDVCPFHQEAEGSFTVYGDSQRFYCFGCGAGRDVLDFVQRMEGLTLPEAIRRLGDGPGPVPAATQRPNNAVVPPRDPALVTAAVRFYAGQLRRSSGARNYLASRGIGPDAVGRLGIG